MKLLTLLVFIFIFSFAKAQECAYTNAEIELKISDLIESQASKLLANLSSFPKETERQQVELFTEGKVEPEAILFEFKNPGLISLDVLANVKTSFFVAKIEEGAVPAELISFTLPSKYVSSSDPYIKNKAQQLQQKDAFSTLVNIAEFVRQSMTYNESHQQLENASTILQKREGVCAHYTILFIALARSLGFPARYVSGIAYSKERGFENHAWSEVYLGEWIPFDPTFGQYGWLDPCHVELQKSLDADKPAITYSYVGKIEPQELKIETRMKSYGKPFRPEFLLEVESEKEVSLDSYVPIKVKARNNLDRAFALPLMVKVAPSLFGGQDKVVVLPSRGEAESWFIIYLNESQQLQCKKGCIVTFEAADWFGNKATSEITFKTRAKKISLEEAQQAAKTKNLIDLYCKTEKDFFYEYEPIKVKCMVENRDETQEFWLEGKHFRVEKGQTEELSLELTINRTGKFIHCLNLTNHGLVATSCVQLELLQSPKIEIKEIKNKEAEYGNLTQLKLLVAVNQPLELRVKLLNTREVYLYQLEQGLNELSVPIKSWKLAVGTNQINIELEFKDKNNKVYSLTKVISFEVKDVSWFKKLLIKLSHLFD